MAVRKKISLRLPVNLMDASKDFCKTQSMNFTYYIETLIRSDLKKRNLFPVAPQIEHGTFDEWGWDEKPKLKKVI